MKVTFEIVESELKNIIRSTLVDFENEKKQTSEIKLYSINQVAKKLGKAHATIKKMTYTGELKTTRGNLISEAAINEYLQNV